MPRKTYQLASRGPARLDLSWQRPWKNMAIRFNGQMVGSVADRRALQEGRSFTLPDGSTLSVLLLEGALHCELAAFQDGGPVLGVRDELRQRLAWAYTTLFVVGLWASLAGLYCLASAVGSVRPSGLRLLGTSCGILTLLFGLLYLMLSVFVRRQSMVALSIAFAVHLLDTIGAAFAYLIAGSLVANQAVPVSISPRTLTVGTAIVFAVDVLALLAVFRGFGALAALRQLRRLTPYPPLSQDRPLESPGPAVAPLSAAEVAVLPLSGEMEVVLAEVVPGQPAGSSSSLRTSPAAAPGVQRRGSAWLAVAVGVSGACLVAFAALVGLSLPWMMERMLHRPARPPTARDHIYSKRPSPWARPTAPDDQPEITFDVGPDRTPYDFERAHRPEPAFVPQPEPVPKQPAAPDVPTRKPYRVLVGPWHTQSIVFSADGQQLLSSDVAYDGSVWDVGSGRRIRKFAEGDATLQLSPDRRQVLTVRSRGAALWDVVSGQQIRQFGDESLKIRCGAMAPDGRRVVTGGKDGVVRLWDAEFANQLQQWEQRTEPSADERARGVTAIAFSPDGQHVLCGDDIGNVLVRNADTGEVRWKWWVGGRVVRVDCSPADATCLVVNTTSVVDVWDLRIGERIRTLQGHSGDVVTAVYSPDGRHIATAGDDDLMYLWDAATGKPLLRFDGCSGGGESLAFSPDGRLIARGKYLWDVRGDLPPERYALKEGRTLATIDRDMLRLELAWLPDGRRVMTSSPLRLWDADSGAQLHAYYGGPWSPYCCAVSPDGRLALVGGGTGATRGASNLFLFEVETARVLKQATVGSDKAEIDAAAFSPDGKRALCASVADGTYWLLEIPSLQTVLRFPSDELTRLHAVILPGGNQALGTAKAATAILWDLEGNRLVRRFQAPSVDSPDDAVRSLSVSPDGRRLLTSSYSGSEIVLWDVQTGEAIRRFQHHAACVPCVAFSPDGRRALSGSDDGTFSYWDVETGREYCRVPRSAKAVAISPDGRRAVAWMDRDIVLWELPGIDP